MLNPSDPLPTLEPYSDRPAKRPWPIKWALLGTLAAAAICLLALYFAARALLGEPKIAPAKTLSTTDLFNLLKLIFAVIAGLGGVVALVVAYRRQKVLEEQIRLSVRTQFHAEQVARAGAYDASERRINDLYAQSVEQLGNSKAAVRLGGLYSLERLAQDYDQHRQAVVDVVCAYLRMPFHLSDAGSIIASPQVPMDSDSSDGPEQELQVRLTAQRLLARHLRAPAQEAIAVSASSHWPNMRIDLAGAHLINLDFSNCSFSSADFSGAQFSNGRTHFENSHFAAEAVFREATFEAGADFSSTRFLAGASFAGCKYNGQASYREARFDDNAGFNRTKFSKEAFFDNAIFSGTTWFRRVEFEGDADFKQAGFGQRAAFDSSIFHGDVNFTRVTFSAKITFLGVQFIRRALFIEARFDGEAAFRNAGFRFTPRFTAARFGSVAVFAPAHFERNPDFARATAKAPNSAHRWPPYWKIDEQVPDGEVGNLISTYQASVSTP